MSRLSQNLEINSRVHKREGAGRGKPRPYKTISPERRIIKPFSYIGAPATGGCTVWQTCCVCCHVPTRRCKRNKWF
jgi:hypothetical protein